MQKTTWFSEEDECHKELNSKRMGKELSRTEDAIFPYAAHVLAFGDGHVDDRILMLDDVEKLIDSLVYFRTKGRIRRGGNEGSDKRSGKSSFMWQVVVPLAEHLMCPRRNYRKRDHCCTTRSSSNDTDSYCQSKSLHFHFTTVELLLFDYTESVLGSMPRSLVLAFHRHPWR